MPKTIFNPNGHVRIGLLAGVALLAMSQSALALDGETFAGRIESLFTSFGVELDLGETVVKGDKIVVSGFTVRSLADAVATSTPVDTELTFTGVEELENGAFTVQTLTIPDIAYSDNSGQFSLSNVAFANLYVPASEKPTAAEMIQLLGEFSAGPLTATANGAELVSIESITSTNTYAPEQGASEISDVTSTFKISGVEVDLSGVTDPEGRAFIQALGLTTITAEFDEQMSWSLGSGDLEVTSLSLDVEELGSVNMTMGLSGYTLGLIQTISDSSAQLAELSAETDADKRAAAEQALGMSILAQLSLTGLSLRYDDASLAEKLITMMATQQGMPPEAMREGLKVAAQQGIAQLGMPQLVEAAAGPIAAFLDDPQSFEVSISPSRSVSFIELVALAQTPAILMQTLQLEITANE